MADTYADEPDAVWDVLTSIRDVERKVALRWFSLLGYNRAAPLDVLIELLNAGEKDFLYREDLPPAILDVAISHGTRRVRVAAAESRQLSADQWERLIAAAQSPDERELFTEFAGERKAAEGQSWGGRGIKSAPYPGATAPATPEEIAVAAAEVPDIDPDHHTDALWWIGALHADAEAMRQLASSPKLLVRRSVARARNLPEDVAALLARDEDRVVRLFLTESCDDAPPEALVDVASWWDGSFSFPGRPYNHPNFPRHGMLRYANDPNPRLRALALRDPAAPSTLVEQMSQDADSTVRRAAARDHRLSPDSLRRLAADPNDAASPFVWMNPALPADTLVRLLLDVRSVEFAVLNPSIPVSVMHHMLAQGIRHSAS